MTNMQAAVGCAQMERIEDILSRREAIADRYSFHLSKNSRLRGQGPIPKGKGVCWMYSTLVGEGEGDLDRDQIIEGLRHHRIDSRPFFYPLHEMPPYRNYGADGLHVSSAIAHSGLSLPTFSGMTRAEVDRVCQALGEISDAG